MAVFIPEIVSALLTMGIFSAILLLVFIGIQKVNHRIQAARMRRKLAGTRFFKAKQAFEETRK